jgi:hypothetical protein
MLAYMQSIVEMDIHLLKCAYENEQIQIHNVAWHAFVRNVSKVDFQCGTLTIAHVILIHL